MTETLAPRAAATRAIRPEDLLAIDTITDAQISPDGARVAFAVKRADLDRNLYTQAIWVAPTDGSAAPRRVTAGSHRDTSPRWSPDGSRLAFLSDRGGKPQIYILDRAESGWGGEPRPVTRLSRGVSHPVWSPDGRRLACLSTEGNGTDDAERERTGGIIRHVTRRRYRVDAVGYIDDRFNHIWVAEADGSGEAVQATWGDFEDGGPAWSPDGKRIAFVSERRPEPRPLFESELYVVDAPATGRAAPDTSPPDGARQISQGTDSASAPAWSPDGASIAYIGKRDHAPGGANTDVFLVPAAGGAPARNLTGSLDRGVGVGVFSDTWSTASAPPTLFWTPDGHSVLTLACDEGRVSLFRADLAGGVKRVVDGDRALAFVSASTDGERLAYAAGSFTNPCDIYTCHADGSGERRLSEINAALLSELPIQAPEHFRFPSFDSGFEVDAWLIRPAGYEAGKRYPLVQIIHGGPHSVFGHTFFFDMQSWASEGWNVLFINPRASQGYGEAFATGNLANWGEGDGREQLMALDLAIERGGVDPDHLAVTGLSYGGYMTNWLIGHTDRYRVAVSENSVANLVSSAGTSDIAWYSKEREFLRPVWENVDFFMKYSPVSYIPNIKTPTLFLQAENDHRCPVEQGEQMFSGLWAMGVPTEMIRFPGEFHGFLSAGKPVSRLERRRYTLRWFHRFI